MCRNTHTHTHTHTHTCASSFHHQLGFLGLVLNLSITSQVALSTASIHFPWLYRRPWKSHLTSTKSPCNCTLQSRGIKLPAGTQNRICGRVIALEGSDPAQIFSLSFFFLKEEREEVDAGGKGSEATEGDIFPRRARPFRSVRGPHRLVPFAVKEWTQASCCDDTRGGGINHSELFAWASWVNREEEKKKGKKTEREREKKKSVE